MKLKVCGMKYNTLDVAALQPDFLGFIFWEGSPRHYAAPALPELPEGTVPVGVFVDAPPELVLDHVRRYALGAVQLHGAESAAYCRDLRTLLEVHASQIMIIKAFSVGEQFGFEGLEAFLPYCDFFLFDTKGKLPGGTGRSFDWELLKGYPYKKPFLLSGGIGEDHCDAIAEFQGSDKANFCIGIDVNSKFEKKPGLKDTEALGRFLECSFWEKPAAGLPKKQHTK